MERGAVRHSSSGGECSNNRATETGRSGSVFRTFSNSSSSSASSAGIIVATSAARGVAPGQPPVSDWEMFQFGKYPMDILEMLSGHQAHQFKGLGLERQLQHQQQVQLQHQQQLQHQHQQQGESGALLSGLGLGSLQSSRSNAFADSSSLFAKMSAPPPIPQQTQSSSQSSRKSSKMSSSSGSGSSSAGYPQFLRPFHPAEAALAQEQLHQGMGRFDFSGGGSGGVVTSAPPPPPLHPGLSVPQASPGPSPSPSSSSSVSASNNIPSNSSTVASLGQQLVGAQSDARSLHQQFSCMLAANQYFLSGVPTNSSLEQFLVQQGSHNHLGLGLSQGGSESNPGLAPPPALHSSHSHSHPTPQQQQQQQQQLLPHALSHPHSHAHPHHPLHSAPQPSPLGGFDFQGIPVLSSNQLASLMQQEAGLPLPLHLSLPKDDGKGDSGSGGGGSGGGRRKKAMAGYLPQRKSDNASSSSTGGNCHSSSGGHGHDATSGLVGGGVGIAGHSGDPSLLSSTSSSSSSTVSSSSSSAPSSSSASVLVANGAQHRKPENLPPMASTAPQPEPEPIYHCGECGKTFTHISSLRRHIRSHGLTDGSPANSGANSNPIQHQPDTSLPHSTQDGRPNSHRQQERASGSQQSNADPTSSSCPSPDKTHCCPECGKGFKKRGHLLQHGVIHSGARPFACGTCQRSFNRRESLTRHEKIHEEKPFRCPACGRCFRESTSLLNHAASGTCGKPGRGSRPRSTESSLNSGDDKSGIVTGGSDTSNYQGGQLGRDEDGLDDLFQQERGENTGSKTEGKYGSDYSRSRYQSSYRVDDYRRQQGNQSPCYSGESSCGNGMSSPALRKAPLAPTLLPHPQNQQQQHHHQQPHLPLSSLLDDSEDEVTSSAMSAIAAAAAASCIPSEVNSGGGRGEERRDIIGGLLGGLGFGNMGVSPGGPSSTSEVDKSYRAGSGGHQGCMSGSTMPLTHPSQPNQPNTGVKPKKPRKPRQKREPRPGGAATGVVKRRRNLGGLQDGAQRPYLCSVCGKGFRRRETLRRHDRVHTGEKPHTCSVCGKHFREAFHLTKHHTVHSGEKNYKCDTCGKEFGYAQSLKRHGKLHRKGEFDGTSSGGNNAKASTGPSQGTVGHDVNQANPDPYYSYPQDKSQGSSSSTTQPLPRLYTCAVCWKSFRHHFHLTAHHQAVHGNGEKLFNCEVCGKAFAYANSLTRHRLSQHGLTRTGPVTPTSSAGRAGGTAGVSSVSESEAATNALLQLGPHVGQQGNTTISHTQHLPSHPSGFSPLFYGPESGHSHLSSSGAQHHTHHHHPQYATGTKGESMYGTGMNSNPSQQTQHHQHHFQSPQYHGSHFHGDFRKHKKKKKRRHGGKPNGKRNSLVRRRKGRMHHQLKRKKWLARLLRARASGGGGGAGVRVWRGDGFKVAGLTSLEIWIKRFPCPYCPSTTFSKRASLLVHRAVRHPPRVGGRQARLRCAVCGKRSRTFLAALGHRSRHLSQGTFSCPKCPSRFWNGTLLKRHRVSCRGISGGGSGNWGLKVKSFLKETVVVKDVECRDDRTTVLTEYRQ